MSDLISRAAALDTIYGIKPVQGNMEQLAMKALCWAAVKTIKHVDAAPVAHARWIETKIPANTTGHGGVGQDKKNGWLCSNCRCAFDAKLLWCQNYCPNCGAKMDGGEANDAD